MGIGVVWRAGSWSPDTNGSSWGPGTWRDVDRTIPIEVVTTFLTLIVDPIISNATVDSVSRNITASENLFLISGLTVAQVTYGLIVPDTIKS